MWVSFLFSSHTFTRHRGCPSGVSPVGQSVPEILDGYVSTIDEPFQVFKCNPPSTCPFEELGFSLEKWRFFFISSGGPRVIHQEKETDGIWKICINIYHTYIFLHIYIYIYIYKYVWLRKEMLVVQTPWARPRNGLQQRQRRPSWKARKLCWWSGRRPMYEVPRGEVFWWLKFWVFPKIGIPQNGWFIMENPI